MQRRTEELASGGRGRLVVLLLLAIALEGDGLWMGPLHSGRQFVLTIGGLAFLSVVCLFVRNSFVGSRMARSWVGLPSGNQGGVRVGLRPRLCLLATLEICSGLLFTAAARHYASEGYRLRPLAVALGFGLPAALFLVLAFRARPARARSVLGVVGLGLVSLFLLAISSCPLRVERSDMLPLIEAADTVALHGHNPYHLYRFATESVLLTYLPGTWAAFLPSSLLGMDPRWVTLACDLLLLLLIYRGVKPEFRLQAAVILGVFFCSPYLQYRHELYTSPHWLCLTASLLLMCRGSLSWSAFWMGVSIAMSQFSWVVFPIFLLFWWQAHGSRAFRRAASISVGTAAVLVLPFLLLSPGSFLYGTLGHWEGQAVSARVINLSYAAAAVVGSRHLAVVQGIVVGAWIAYSMARRSCRTPTRCLGQMCVALTLFVLLNILVWGYFFLLIGLLLVLYTFAGNDWLGGGDEVAVAGRPESYLVGG